MPDMPTDQEIKNLQKDGHTFHCAMRILTGDGECECGKTSTQTPGMSGKLYGHKCAVCMCDDGMHEGWCRNKKGCPECQGGWLQGNYCPECGERINR